MIRPEGFSYASPSSLRSRELEIQPYYATPLVVPKEKSPIWKEILVQCSWPDLIQEWEAQSGKKYAGLHSPWEYSLSPKRFQHIDLFDTTRGVANLINHVLQPQKDRLDTLIFLDKSARNAAYCFLIMWRRLAQISPKFAIETRPKVLYLNVGKSEHEWDNLKLRHTPTLSLLDQIYLHSDIANKQVVVVDEKSYSGLSLLTALEIIPQWVRPKTLEGISLFRNLPEWYSTPAYKGIAEYSPDILDLDDIESLSEDEFFWLSQRPELIPSFFPEMDAESVLDVKKYFQRAGGFVGQPLTNKKERVTSLLYRRYLKKALLMATDYIELAPNYKS